MVASPSHVSVPFSELGIYGVDIEIEMASTTNDITNIYERVRPIYSPPFTCAGVGDKWYKSSMLSV